MEPGIYIVLAIIVLLIIIVISNIKIVPQAYVFVVERLGAFHAAWGTGLHVKVPFIDRVAKRVSIKEQVVDFKPQSVITKDNVTMHGKLASSQPMKSYAYIGLCSELNMH